MTTITAHCPICGEVVLRPDQIRLLVCSRAELSTYSFICPTDGCGEVKMAAEEDTVALLMSGGVVAKPWHIPSEALERKTGPRFTYDDLLDFALELERHKFLVADPSFGHLFHELSPRLS